MAEHAPTTNRALGARPAATFSTVQTAHLDLVTRLAATRPHLIVAIADRHDVQERAGHVRDVLGSVLAYIGTVVADTNDNLPTGLLDGAYVMRCVSGAAGDVASSLLNAADDLAAGRT
jgi:hypothetical protein